VHFPHTTTRPLRAEFAHFPWRRNAKHLRAWQRGRTGFALVDAGMHELWATGYMHNRVRMVTASFLGKNLMQPWQDGARWFWDTAPGPRPRAIVDLARSRDAALEAYQAMRRRGR
jgi:deoxyribodipyrimidine photo-lyase